MLGKERRGYTTSTDECCLLLRSCAHSSGGYCCRTDRCIHSTRENGGGYQFNRPQTNRQEDNEEMLPPPPPRGISSAQSVQALKLKIEAGTPESRRKVVSRRGDIKVTPVRNLTRDPEVRSRGDVVTSRGAVVVTSRGVLMTAVDDNSPRMSLRSEGSGRSLYNNSEDKSSGRNGPPLRRPSLLDSVRTPIARNSGKQYKSLDNVPHTSDHDIDYLKEELVTRLLKEKEELLKLRRLKETQREKLLEYRREQQSRHSDEFETTPEARPRLQELDRSKYVVQETPVKSDSASSPDSACLSPRYRLKDTLKSEAATRILFSEYHQRSASDVTCHVTGNGTQHVDNAGKRTKNAGATTSDSDFKQPAVISRGSERGLTSDENVDRSQIPTSPPSRRVTVATAPTPSQTFSLTKHQSPPSMMTTPTRPRSEQLFVYPTPLKQSGNQVTCAGRKTSTPVRDPSKHPAINPRPCDTPKTPLDKQQLISPTKLFTPMPPELGSVFEERAVDCPTDSLYLRKTFSLETGNKLSPPGYDVVRTVVRTDTGPDQGAESVVNPALLQPFKRRSRKSKESKETKDKCNTQ